MDVTKDNFEKALKEFEAAIAESDFAAIDMEMTGLYESKEHQPSHLDTLDERYAKLKRSVELYGVIQVGICLFTWTANGTGDTGGYYEARPFNFNVFPGSSAGGIAVDTHFGCKSSAFEFLARNAFDFNKWVYQGVPYLRTEDAERIRKERMAMLTSRQRKMDADDRHRGFVRDFELALGAFVESGEQVLRYETGNSYQRKLIHNIVSSHDTLGTRGRSDCIEIFKGSHSAMAKHTAHKIKTLNQNVKHARGFCAVIDMLSAARKPVVGHNMLLDVLHAFSKFYRPLPAGREEFERALAQFLPVLIDTKFIIESTPAIKDRYGTSSLDEIAPMLEREAGCGLAPIRLHPRFMRNATRTMHEAGYDAYMTGASFIRLLKLDGGVSRAAEQSSELVLYRYINKLHLSTAGAKFWAVAS
ncbi:ribonuclease CAF1 [Coemansia reversa NRRL 1564]|uniref:Ribonuclease CAF1 n=1 Tax=Coemansia reversa (strain ATCC 12441 / NRRL 1564) TaxID=763665 RepID=A0A2G5BE73_COERN|nr:ribonuclease CAF1 [Coemansia reversa NRRL 1564]|eukprot:PIA17318.1 ribonuclease CAF1 [Coemansia reversa NRRL 1564]